jgi:hypothetical protein
MSAGAFDVGMRDVPFEHQVMQPAIGLAKEIAAAAVKDEFQVFAIQ